MFHLQSAKHQVTSTSTAQPSLRLIALSRLSSTTVHVYVQHCPFPPLQPTPRFDSDSSAFDLHWYHQPLRHVTAPWPYEPPYHPASSSLLNAGLHPTLCYRNENRTDSDRSSTIDASKKQRYNSSNVQLAHGNSLSAPAVVIPARQNLKTDKPGKSEGCTLQPSHHGRQNSGAFGIKAFERASTWGNVNRQLQEIGGDWTWKLCYSLQSGILRKHHSMNV